MSDLLRAARSLGRQVYRADPVRTVASTAVNVGATICDTLGAVVLKHLVDAVTSGDRGGVTVASFLLVGTLIGSLLGHWATVTLGMALRERSTLQLDSHLARLSLGIHHLEHHERPDYLDQLEVLRRNHQRLAAVHDSMIANLTTIVRLGIVIVLLGRIHPLLLLLPVAGVPTLLANVKAARMRHAVEDELAASHRFRARMFEIATTRDAAKELRIYGAGEEVRRRWDEARAAGDAIEERIEVRTALLSVASWLAFGAGLAAALLLVAREAVEGRATAGDVVLALTMAGGVNWGVGGLAHSATWLLDNLKLGRRLLWLEDLAAEAALRAKPPSPAPVPDRLAEGIRLEGVSFRYPGTEEDVLSGVDLFLPAGSTVAVVGDNGAGKSTLVKLLCRFYDPTVGRVTVDGTDVREFDVTEWRQRLSGCFQDFARLELLAREVVGVGYIPDIDHDAAVLGALGRAHATELPGTLQGGLSAQLGRSFDGGVEPSAGQWQKLALGRAMMREQPLLLLLDEPTASLDAPTEHALFERYAGAASEVARRAGAITVLVSHRFSTVRMADLIVVFEGGRVAEVGTHQELVAAGGTYGELYGLQARAYG
ncbi:MAG TPA: ABC transporter ATP-binding protein [Acidimicrobiales bacterium]